MADTGMQAGLGGTPLLDSRPVRDAGGPVSGTCGALARRLDLDPVLVRVVTVFACLTAGFGVGAYAAAWLLWPARADAASAFERVVPGSKRWSSSTRMALIVAGGVVTTLMFSAHAPFDLAALLIAAGFLWWTRRQSDATITAPAAPGTTPTPYPPPPAGLAARPVTRRRRTSWALSIVAIVTAIVVGDVVWRLVSPDEGAFLAGTSASLLVAALGLTVSAFTRKTQGVWTFTAVCVAALIPALALEAHPPTPETLTYAQLADDDAVIVGKNTTVDLRELPEDLSDPVIVIALYGKARVVLPEDVDASVSYSTVLSQIHLPGTPPNPATASWHMQAAEGPRVIVVAVASNVEVRR